ncbi:M23 family metallopeptidase [Streptomyces sp. TLI_171]|uniref:M23 family metallopeptidase n=1 Tax=Streptomyces sp. TLI_171 TaxID=1938859 RepID=UPI000E7093DD|nr:M23 family metallopeptidase [Streptomyces sp. TLI_171]RKE23716.1 peptidase M23-like protein [Streptomyces sp. TLI_171]
MFAGATTTAVDDFKAGRQLTGGSTVGPTTWQYLLGAAAGSGVHGGYAFVVPKGAVSGGRDSLLQPHHDYPAADIPVVEWTDAFAVTSGTARQNGGASDACGYGLAIDGDDGVTYQYCHLNSRLVATGTRVTPGQLVALHRQHRQHHRPAPALRDLPRRRLGLPAATAAALWDGATRRPRSRCRRPAASTDRRRRVPVRSGRARAADRRTAVRSRPTPRHDEQEPPHAPPPAPRLALPAVAALTAGLLTVLAPAGSAPPPASAATASALTADLDRLLTDPRLAGATAAVKVVDADTGEVLYAHDSSTWCCPPPP